MGLSLVTSNRFVCKVIVLFVDRKSVATPSELRLDKMALLFPGFQSKPWAEIRERFQRLSPSANLEIETREVQSLGRATTSSRTSLVNDDKSTFEAGHTLNQKGFALD